jgi:hypothetical protein
MSETTQLTVVERAAIALNSTESRTKLRELAAQSASIVEIKNKAAREQCHSAAMVLRTRRTDIRKTGKTAREDATAFQKAVISEEDELVALIEPEEVRLITLRDAWDEAEAAEKRAKAEAEQKRVQGIRQRIDEIRATPTKWIGKPSADIGAAADVLSETIIDLASWQEFTGEATVERDHAVKTMREMQQKQAAHEAEQAQIAAAHAELERLRIEAAERERVAAAERAEEEARLQAQREAHEAELRRQQAAAEAGLRVERERIESENRAAQERADATARAEREAAQRAADAMQEIQGIQQQVMIAVMGRAGVRKGGTIECIRETLAETEAWTIDDRFDILQGAAELAKTTAVAEIRRLLAEAEAKEAAEAEARARQGADEAAARAEAQRIEDQKRAEEMERIQRELDEFAINGPGDVEIVRTLAEHYDVPVGDVMQWMKKFDYSAADEQLAAENVSANRLGQAA